MIRKNKYLYDFWWISLVLVMLLVNALEVYDAILLQLSLAVFYILAFKSTEIKNFTLFVFLIFFGLFIAIPLFVGGFDIENLKSGLILKDIYLEDYRSLYYVVLLYLFCIYLFNNLLLRKRIRFIGATYKFNISNSLIDFIFVVLAIYVFFFYYQKILAIQQEGYAAYHLGTISIKKSLIFVISEVFFLFYLYYGVWCRRPLYYVIFIAYYFAILLTGMRMPFILYMIILFYFINFHNIQTSVSRVKYYIGYFVMIVIVPPLLMISARFRVGNLEDVTIYSLIQDSYIELYSILGITLNTLKGAIIMFDTDTTFSLFSRFTSTVLSIFNKLTSGEQLSMQEKLDYGTFGSVVTNYFDSDIYEKGVTIASSFISESYMFSSYLGVIFIAFFHVYLTKFLSSLRIDFSFISWIIYLTSATWLLNSVRNDAVGWIPLALIYMAIFYILYLIHPKKEVDNK